MIRRFRGATLAEWGAPNGQELNGRRRDECARGRHLLPPPIMFCEHAHPHSASLRSKRSGIPKLSIINSFVLSSFRPFKLTTKKDAPVARNVLVVSVSRQEMRQWHVSTAHTPFGLLRTAYCLLPQAYYFLTILFVTMPFSVYTLTKYVPAA